MDDLLAARLSMATSLGFHIIFAAIGMSMPILMAISHWKFLKTKKDEYLILTKMWMKGTAILFAVGAVSGTVLSFELGLLWPHFMKHAGPIIGMPFSWEGTAFFIEAIALGLYLYGWKKMSPWIHWWTGVAVAVSGFASGVFIVAANGWMNSPQGFTVVDGVVTNIEPIKAMFNPAWLHQSLHMQVAALQAVGAVVAGVHAFQILRKKNYSLNMRAFFIAGTMAASMSLVQPFVGHFAAQRVAELQPLKLAALEGHFYTQEKASLSIGGWPNIQERKLDYALELPGMLSFLAFNDFDAEVKGLNDFPEENWPPLAITHLSFQLMVAIGTFLAFVALIFFYMLYIKNRKNLPTWFLSLMIIAAPMGFIAIEAGWIVTEVGRQPWIIYGFLKTKDALTDVPGMVYHFYFFLIIYICLGAVTLWLFKRQLDAAEFKTEQEVEKHD